MKILVIGGSGFVGRPLVEKLATLGHAVTHISRKPSIKEHIDGAKWFCCDRLNVSQISSIIKAEAVEAIVDCCGKNELAIETTLAACGKSVQHYVLLSSAAVYGSPGAIGEDTPARPSFPLGEAKLRAERKLINCKSKKMSATIIRPSEVFGPGDSSPQRAIYFAKGCVNGAPVVIPGRAESILGPIFVECLVEMIVKATLRPIASSFIVNAGGSPISFRQLHEAWIGVTQKAVPLIEFGLSLEEYSSWQYRNQIPAFYYTFADCYCRTELAQKTYD